MEHQVEDYSGITLGIIGSVDFARRTSSALSAQRRGLQIFTSTTSEAWGHVLAQRPNAIILELGFQYSDRTHAWARSFLSQLRERFENEVYVIVALTAPEKLMFGGDFLFANEDDLEPSNFVDTFVAHPPGSIPSMPLVTEQLSQVMWLYHLELQRRLKGEPALPPLGAEGWVQSLADIRSRELWMRWLPRYASYTNENPIIIGETGTGKTNLAYALHLLSGREGKFVSVTPRDFSSPELVQAELFGAVAGAYTGAVDKWGLVKSAEKGTLFIDELQSIDKDLQGKLITFIENKAYRRVGSAESIEADVRFVFASNKTLYEMMESDILRHDFAYRLERVQLELAPLQGRRLDIAAALGYALAKIHRQRPHDRITLGVNSQAYRLLFSHNWPGNLRQLENRVAQLCEIADMNGVNIIDEAAVTHVFESKLTGIVATPPEVLSKAALKLAGNTLSNSIGTLENSVESFVEFARESALEACGGDVDRAAQMIEDNSQLMNIFAHASRAAQEIDGFDSGIDS